MRILVVDDNADAADSLAILLAHEGYLVTTADDPVKGLQAAEHSEHGQDSD